MVKFFLLFFFSTSIAEITITKIISSEEVEINSNEQLVESDIYPVYNKKIVGFIFVTKVLDNHNARARIVSHSQNAQIIVGDKAKKINYKRKSSDFLGRTDLQLSKKEFSSRYKPLVFQDPILGQTAQTLDENEHLIDMYSYYMYGITRSISFYTLFLGQLKAANGGLKYNFYNDEGFVLSAALASAYIYKSRSSFQTVSLYFDSFSNGKFISHTLIDANFFNDNDKGGNEITKSLVQSRIQSGTEYIFDNWDRLIFGPQYNFDSRAVGGFFGYIFIWDHFHLAINVQTKNILKLRLRADAYIPTADAYWRF